MLNHYPVWKNCLLLGILLLAALYAVPNLYPEDPSVQISHDSGELPPGLAIQVERILENNKHNYKTVEETDLKQLLIRFDDTETQLAVADELKSSLSSQHVVALNLAPAVPEFLQSLNAGPMSLGLDLRGGVHFLMQVDMGAAISKALDSPCITQENDLETLFHSKY